MSRQELLFPIDQENRAIAARYRETFRDRKIARHLMSADSWERETIEMLMEDFAMTLYEAIDMCIKHPADRE
ncbi:MAG: hypothetical protein J0L53_18825 [Spirochaetes bacterium]|nr:hypothetical protein [Spirochaetota bacterium]